MTESEHYVTVHVATDLLAKLREWSQPVQAQIQETPSYGTGYEMIFRVYEPTLTASEVKVLTETASKVAYALGRKDAGEEIAEGIEATRDAVGLFPIENLEDLLTSHQAWTNAAQIARDIASQPSEAASDATSGVPGHPEVSEAVRSPQERGRCSHCGFYRSDVDQPRHHPNCPRNTTGALDPGDPS